MDSLISSTWDPENSWRAHAHPACLLCLHRAVEERSNKDAVAVLGRLHLHLTLSPTTKLFKKERKKKVQAKTAYDAAAFFWKGKIVKIILKLLSSAQFRPSTIKIVNLVPELYKWVRFYPYAELACHGRLSHQRRVSLGLHTLVKYPFYL